SFFACVFALHYQAQSWCPPGARWTHNYNSDGPGGYQGVSRITYEGDMVFNGQQVQRLRVSRIVAPWGTTNYALFYEYTPWLTRYEDDVVYCWSINQEEFDTLMWFDATPGQFWSWPSIGDHPTARITVLDTSSIEVEGQVLRQLIVETGQSDGMPPDTLRERIGFSMLYLKPDTWFYPDPPSTGLLCYSDYQLMYAGPGVTDCGYTLSVADQHEDAVTVHPNPGTDRFSLNLPPGSHTVEVRDISGKLVHHTTLMHGMPVDASSWLPGTYLVRLPELGRSFRWVKQ
ncbi:MAG TPA: T9SS type A sorting domain-containing protein, partial [Flavobacteriales bacterium]|nr:T9SS type A sorting domain-containing protein [Flavobacteriales bacterium]